MSYSIEYASTARAKCKHPSCPDKTIPKGALRFASIGNIKGFDTKFWRHWECVTPAILKKIPAAGSIEGFEDLTEEDRERVQAAVHQQREGEEQASAGQEVAAEEGTNKEAVQATIDQETSDAEAEEEPIKPVRKSSRTKKAPTMTSANTKAPAASKSTRPKRGGAAKAASPAGDESPVSGDSSEAAPVRGRGRKRKESPAETSSAPAKPTRKGGRGKKALSATDVTDNDDVHNGEETAQAEEAKKPVRKVGRPRKVVATSASPKSAPKDGPELPDVATAEKDKEADDGSGESSLPSAKAKKVPAKRGRPRKKIV